MKYIIIFTIPFFLISCGEKRKKVEVTWVLDNYITKAEKNTLKEEQKNQGYQEGLAEEQAKTPGETTHYYDIGETDGDTDGYKDGYDTTYKPNYDIYHNMHFKDFESLGRSEGAGDGQVDGTEDSKREGYNTGYDEQYDLAYGYNYDDEYDDGYDYGWDVGYDSGFNWGSIIFSVAENGNLRKDLEKVGSKMEKGKVDLMASSLESNYGLSVKRSGEVAYLLYFYKEYAETRKVTEKEANQIVKKLIGTDFNSAKEAVLGNAQGNVNAYQDLINKAAKMNGISPEAIGQLVLDLM